VSAPSRHRPRLRPALTGARARFEGLESQDRRLVVLSAALFVALGLALAAVPLLGASGATPGERTRDSFLARLVPAPEQARADKPVAPEVRKAADGLSIPERVDQLLLLGFNGTDAGEPERRLARGELGGLAVAEENYNGANGLRQLVRDTRDRAREEGRLPPLFMVSQEGGDLSALAGLPPRYAPADTASVEEGAEAALDSARALSRIGLDGVLGPVLDVGATDGGPLGLRVFSDNPSEIARYARATVTAYVESGLLSAPLHFPGGLGQAATSTDEGPAQVAQTLDDLRRRDLLPFRVAIDAGAQALVVGHGLYGTDDFAAPASASRFILTDLLRGELGFEGLAITDDLAAGAITIPGSSAEAGVASIVAGADMVRLSGPPQEQERMRAALLAAARTGRISRERLDDAVVRVLEAKRAAGLLGRDRRSRDRDARPDEAPRARPPARPAPPRATAAPRPPRPVPGVDRREGRPKGPGGGPGPAPREPAIPGVRRREGRPPVFGVFILRPPAPEPTFESPRSTFQTTPGGVPGSSSTSPDGTTTYFVPAP